jgi:hypothetical protein
MDTCKDCGQPIPVKHRVALCDNCTQRHNLALMEEVRGVVIGAVTSPYEFWSKDYSLQIAKGSFESDSDAVDWFRASHPAWYSQGVEMRAY